VGGAQMQSTPASDYPVGMAPMLSVRRFFLIALSSQVSSGDGRLNGQVFDRYSSLASSHEVARRSLSPANYDRFQRYLRVSQHGVEAQAIDLAEEKFDMYVPARAAGPDGYGLLVWVAPQEDYPAPGAWLSELDRRGIIYVAARRSGNVHRVLDRRIPLALHAAENVMHRYPVDKERVYAGGFSGGSRTALKLAVGYPDLVRGALLNAGSDVFGGNELVLPSAALTELLQERSRLVYVTGVLDMPNKRRDEASRVSAGERCIRHLHTLWMPGVEHAPLDRRAFARAMALLDEAPAPDAGLPACRARVMAGIGGEMDALEELFAQGKIVDAGERLGDVDAAWGGLAAPRSVLLARRISERINAAPN
jgi:predicted esterase